MSPFVEFLYKSNEESALLLQLLHHLLNWLQLLLLHLLLHLLMKRVFPSTDLILMQELFCFMTVTISLRKVIRLFPLAGKRANKVFEYSSMNCHT